MKLIIAEKPSVAFAIVKKLDIKGSKGKCIENNGIHKMELCGFADYSDRF